MTRRSAHLCVTAAMVMVTVGCAAHGPPMAEAPLAAPAEDICGSPPTTLEGELLPTTEHGIASYVAADGREEGAPPLRVVLGREQLTCDALSFRACEAAVAQGADASLALEVHRLTMGARVCKQASAMAKVPTKPKLKPARGQWRPGTYMVQALSRVATAAQRAQRGQYALDNQGSSVLGAFLKGGSDIDMTRELKGEVKYTIVAGGSDSVQDLGVAIFDASGKQVAADKGDSAVPMVDFTPPTTAQFRIVLSLRRSRAAGSFAALSILRSGGGYRMPPRSLARSFGSALALASIASRKIANNDSSLVFHANGDWAFYGTVMEQGESLAFGGFDLSSPATVVLAASDGAADDIDLEVVASSTNRVMGHDRGDDNTPIVLLRTDTSGSYAVRMSTPKASQPSLVSVLVLDVNE